MAHLGKKSFHSSTTHLHLFFDKSVLIKTFHLIVWPRLGNLNFIWANGTRWSGAWLAQGVSTKVDLGFLPYLSGNLVCLLAGNKAWMQMQG